MNKIMKTFNLQKPVSTLMPWKHLGGYDNVEFRNLQHFIHTVGGLTQLNDTMCDVTYKQALHELRRGISNFPVKEQEDIRNLVRSNLHKRGLITQEVYEDFKYTDSGTCVGVDIGKYAAGEPDCIITPTKQYVDFFYELFISVSYPYSVENSEVRKNTAKLLATIEELERQHIFIKVTLVFPARGVTNNSNLFVSIPLFSHKDTKSVGTMSSVVNERLLRKFMFAIMEGLYGNELKASYGHAEELVTAMSIGDTFNEIDFFTEIQRKVGAT